DLFASLEQTPPVPLKEPEVGIFQSLWEIAFPKEIDWDDAMHKDRGITAVAPLSSRWNDPFSDEKMRNGPIASGNAHGDFYLLDLYGGEDEMGTAVIKCSYKRIMKLHDGMINDLSVGALYSKEEEEGNTFEIATAGEDSKCK
ncbi:unnamed protein product, partial [Symbiodinium pilosum]